MMSRIAISTTVAASMLLLGCGSRPTAQESGSLSDADKVEAIASTLQACSYDGRPVKAEAASFTGDAPNDCVVAVKRIMNFTGLPSNFVVVSGPVDNAAAVILLDQNQIPQRVIAFNADFLAKAQARAGGSKWAPISVLAHEIAHHLSGHTIVPGGSRPSIELEADKFSGFVMQKMGAPLTEATRMILAVGSDHASATHPDKAQRAEAIRQGWAESCTQAGRADCTGPSRPAPPAPGPLIAAALPAPGSIPFKYGRFVVDETGKLDPAMVKAMDQRLYALAKDVGVEFTILMVNDLKGMTAQDYARAMMRQLRIGKLDVGNGAVAVVAPKQRQAAVAFGPGLAKEAEFFTPDKMMLDWIDAAWTNCDDADGCRGWTDNLFSIFNPTLRSAGYVKWTIQFQTLRQLLDHYDRQYEERMRSKRPFDPKIDQPIGNLLRLKGRITSLRPSTGIGQVNERLIGGKLGYTAVGMTTDDGLPVILYVAPTLPTLMPSGALKVGKDYTFVGRLQTTGDQKKQASGLWLFSYDEL